MVSVAKKTTTGSFIGDYFVNLMAQAKIPDDELNQKWHELNHTYRVVMGIVKPNQCNSAVLLYEYGPELYLRIVLSKDKGAPTKTIVVVIKHLNEQRMLFKIEDDIDIKERAISPDEVLEIVRSGGFQDITEEAFPPLLN